MDWLVKHDAVIICGEKVVRIPYRNKALTFKSDKGMSRLKVISCIKARKYIKRGSHLFLAHVTKKKPKDMRLEDVPIIRDFPKNNQKQRNARAMTTALNEGKVSSGLLHICEHCFTRHVGQCTIKCHKCGKIGHKARYCKEKNVATGANAQPIWTCYDCG
nr:reverse transcriptase domain-containing protein [Tanacetum cinerariifolium]